MCDKLTGEGHFLKIVGTANGFNTSALISRVKLKPESSPSQARVTSQIRGKLKS